MGQDVCGICCSAERRNRVKAALEKVEFSDGFAIELPGALSGSEGQPVTMARALVCERRVVVLDEPKFALDVLVRSRVLKLLDGLRRRRELTYLFITRGPSVVRNVADPVAECRAGRLQEYLPTERVFDDPEHDYMRQFIAAVLVISDVELALAKKLARRNE